MTSKKRKKAATGILGGLDAADFMMVGGAMLVSYFVLKTYGKKDGDGGESGETERATTLRDILGGAPSEGGRGAPTVYNLPAQGDVTFPAPTDYSSLLKTFAAPAPDPRTGVTTSRQAILGAHRRVVSKGFDVSTTVTGTAATPAFVQKDVYHKAMLSELGLSKKEALSAGSAPVVSALQKGFVSRASGGSSIPAAKKTPSAPKKSTYVRRSQKGYTYSKTGSLTKK